MPREVQIEGLPDPRDPAPEIVDILLAIPAEVIAEVIIAHLREAEVPPPSPPPVMEVKS